MIRREKEALERSFICRLRRHWVWPHIMVLFVFCLVIGLVALGFGIVWLVEYMAGIEGSGTTFWIVAAGLLLAGIYRVLYKIFRCTRATTELAETTPERTTHRLTSNGGPGPIRAAETPSR